MIGYDSQQVMTDVSKFNFLRISQIQCFAEDLMNRTSFFNQVKESIDFDEKTDLLFKALVFAMGNDHKQEYINLVEDVLTNIKKLKLSVQDDRKVIEQLQFHLRTADKKYWQHFYDCIFMITHNSSNIPLKDEVILFMENETRNGMSDDVRTYLNSYIKELEKSIKE